MGGSLVKFLSKKYKNSEFGLILMQFFDRNWIKRQVSILSERIWPLVPNRERGFFPHTSESMLNIP